MTEWLKGAAIYYLPGFWALAWLTTATAFGRRIPWAAGSRATSLTCLATSVGLQLGHLLSPAHGLSHPAPGRSLTGNTEQPVARQHARTDTGEGGRSFEAQAAEFTHLHFCYILLLKASPRPAETYLLQGQLQRFF